MINIITINWNNVAGLKKTFSSLSSQTLSKDKWRFIIIDGMSTDGSVEFLNSNKSFIDKLIVEQDQGVYDAMNKGILHVPDEEYFLFLNSGDEFARKDTLDILDNAVNTSKVCTDVFYGDKIDENGFLQKAYFPESMQYGIINACHQSILYKKYTGVSFDLRYKLFSDLDFTISYYKRNNNFIYINAPISVYEGGGLSSIHQWKTKKEIYNIVYRQFGILTYSKFLCVKMLKIFGIKHTSFLKKHS